MNTNKTEKTKSKPKTDWLRNTAIGLLLFISGFLSKFFPATVMTVTYVVSGVVLALIGISDAVAALKYKETGSDWKLVLVMGVITIIAAVYFIPAVIYLYSINTSIYVISAWLIIRGALNIAGFAKGTFKRKHVLLWAVVMIASGCVALFFCEPIVSYSASYLAYVLIAAGVLMTFYGIYQKTDEKERKEKTLREEAVASGIGSVAPAKQSELIASPEDLPPAKETTPAVPPSADLPDAQPAAEKPSDGETSPRSAPDNSAEKDKADISDVSSADKPKEPEITPSEKPVENAQDKESSPDNAADDIIEVEAEVVENSAKPQTKKKGLFDSLFKKK